MPNKLSRFWNELRRRKVIRSLAIYAGTAFIILEASSIIFPLWNFPEWSINLVLWILILGGFVNVIIAWFYDITPEGMRRTKPMEEVTPEERIPDSRGWKAATYISLVVIVSLIVLHIAGGLKQLRTGDIQSVVILPFDNLTGDDELDYFVEGMHASLINDMGKLSGLRVICKTSASAYRDMDLTASEIARELNVDAVVEGSIMCLDDSICSQFRLVNTSGEEKQLWTADYKEDKSLILNLYNRITKKIADEIMVELTPEEERLLDRDKTVDREAYDAYLRSHQYWDDFSKEPLLKALEYLNIAVEKEQEWAPLYAGLAKVWIGLAQFNYVSPEIAGPKIFENINKALELDPDLPETHFVNGLVSWSDWKWEKGEKAFLNALAVNPSDAMSRIYYAHFLAVMQRPEEALVQGRLAVDLDPLNPLIQSLYAPILANAGDWEAAQVQLDKVLADDPENYFANNLIEIVAYHCKNYDRVFESIKKNIPFEDSVMKDIEKTFKEQRFVTAYKKMLSHMELMAPENPDVINDMAIRYGLVNNYSKAMDWVEILFESSSPNMPYLVTGYAKLDSLYDDPRFIAILEKMNLSVKEN